MHNYDNGATISDRIDDRKTRYERRSSALTVAQLIAWLGVGALLSGLWILASALFFVALVIGIANWR